MSWKLQKINNGGNTTGPAAVQVPFVSVYNSQQHVTYRDSAGDIWDSWYDPPSNSWKLQKINTGGNTTGPAAVEGPFIGTLHNQQHFAYIDDAGNLWDSWYDGSANRWNLQKINNGGMTTGPGALHGTCVWVWNAQQHFTYVGASGTIWDSFWDGADELTVTPTTIVWNHNVDLEGLDTGSIQGPIGLTITSNGNYNFTGQLHKSALAPYNFSVLLVLKSKSGTAFTFGVSGSIGALPNDYPPWDNNGNNGTIKDVWADLEAGCTLNYRGQANVDLPTLWNDIQSAIGFVEKVVAVVGPFL